MKRSSTWVLVGVLVIAVFTASYNSFISVDSYGITSESQYINNKPTITPIFTSKTFNVLVLSRGVNYPYPPSIIITTTRVAAILNEYTRLGQNLLSQTPINLTNIIEVSIPYLVEYKDLNGNNLFDFNAPSSDTGLVSRNNYTVQDQIIKYLDLRNIDWEINVKKDLDTDSIIVYLNATKIPYVGAPLKGVLHPDDYIDKLSFSLILSRTGRSEVQRYKLPLIEVQRTLGDRVKLKSEPGENSKLLMAEKFSVSWKMNHYIEGWDFVDNSTLFLGVRTFSGELIRDLNQFRAIELLTKTKLSSQLLASANANLVRYTRDNGTVARNIPVTAIRRLQFLNQFQPIMNYSWTNTYQTNTNTKETLYQINRLEAILTPQHPSGLLPDEIRLLGFYQQGGFNYEPDTTSSDKTFILHDPTLDLDVINPKVSDGSFNIQSSVEHQNRIFILLTTVLLVIVIIRLKK